MSEVRVSGSEALWSNCSPFAATCVVSSAGLLTAAPCVTMQLNWEGPCIVVVLSRRVTTNISAWVTAYLFHLNLCMLSRRLTGSASHCAPEVVRSYFERQCSCQCLCEFPMMPCAMPCEAYSHTCCQGHDSHSIVGCCNSVTFLERKLHQVSSAIVVIEVSCLDVEVVLISLHVRFISSGPCDVGTSCDLWKTLMRNDGFSLKCSSNAGSCTEE